MELSSSKNCGPFLNGVDFFSDPPAVPDRLVPDAHVTVAELMPSEQQSWLQMQRKWSGKCIEVTGVSRGSLYTVDGQEQLTLGGSDSDLSLSCIVDRGTWLQAHKGQHVVLRGLWNSNSLQPQLIHCKVIEVKGDPTIRRFTIDSFAASFGRTIGESSNDQVLIEGVIEKVRPSESLIPGMTIDRTPFWYILLRARDPDAVELCLEHDLGVHTLSNRPLQQGDSIGALCSTRFAESYPGEPIQLMVVAIVRRDSSGAVLRPANKSSDDASVWIGSARQFDEMCVADLYAHRTKFPAERFQISGSLMRISPPGISISHVPVLKVSNGSGTPIGVQCLLQTGTNWTMLRPGQEVTVEGRLTPFGTLGGALIDCRILSTNGCAKVYTPSELYRAVVGTDGAAAGQYHMMGIAVSGKVCRKSDASDDWVIVEVVGAETIEIPLEFGCEHWTEAMCDGDIVTMTGKCMCVDEKFYLNECLVLPPRD